MLRHSQRGSDSPQLGAGWCEENGNIKHLENLLSHQISPPKGKYNENIAMSSHRHRHRALNEPK